MHYKQHKAGVIGSCKISARKYNWQVHWIGRYGIDAYISIGKNLIPPFCNESILAVNQNESKSNP